MFAFGRFLVTAALWHGARSAPHTEPDCDEPVSATSSALLQSRRQKRDLAEPFGLDLDLGSGSATFNRSGLAAHCRPQALHAQPSAYVANKLEVLKETTMSSKGSCSGISLVNFDTHTSSTTCCPVDSLSCGGCAKYASSKCEQCLGGFLLKDGKCTACISTVGWTNELGDTCDAIPAADCNDRPVNGLSSNQACCQCNGGEKTATPFSYPDTRFAVGAAVSLKPLPRTAERYSVDSGCGFAAHNLTIDGATGAITSTQNPTKPFTVECEVSAHQALHLVSTVKVSVTVEFMSCGAGALFFSSGVTSYPVTLGSAAADWNDFGMVCAPEAPWLSIASSGAVSTSSSTSGGAVTDTETPDGDFVGIDGSVCVVSAKQKSGNETQKRSTTFVALKPKPWPTLSFENSYVDVVIGEELAPMKPEVPSGYEEGTGGLKPSSWYVKCFVDGDWAGTRSAPHWSFDTNWGVGLLGSHSILEVQPDGAITIAPGETMAKLFDEILADNLQRKSILLNCGIWGSFPGSDFPDLRTTMLIRIKDSMCWISETFQGKVIEESTVLTEAVCRNKCRLSKRCSHLTWSQDKCKHYRVENEGGSPVTAYAKVTGCTDMGTCLRLAHSEWVLAGDYCPIGFQAPPAGLEVSREVTQIRAQDNVQMSGQLTTQGDYILQPGPDVCYGADQFTCGLLEFNLKCSKETKLKFKAEMIGPDGASDSMWVQIKGTGSRLAWHTGQTSDWGWSSADSPEVTAPAGNSVMQFYGREKNFKVRHFKIVHGEADCKFVGPPAKTRTRLVVYKKESSIPQEVMYLSTSSGTSTCAAGKWLVQKASDDDYVDAQLGYFELKGAEQVCIEGNLPSSATSIKLDLATLPCARPLFPEAEEEALQSLVFDDPSTSQPNDFWLHPCDCLPQQWGTEWPADPIALENIPPTSNGSFIPEPFSIVSGQFACPSRQLLKGAKGIHFQSEAESMEPADCEERCKDYKEELLVWNLPRCHHMSTL